VLTRRLHDAAKGSSRGSKNVSPGTTGELACRFQFKEHVHFSAGIDDALHTLHEAALIQILQDLCDLRLLQICFILQVLGPNACVEASWHLVLELLKCKELLISKY
jgi:hypothetical protein